MFIKYNKLTIELPKKFPALFFLLGQELFQVNQLTKAIKKTWSHAHLQETETQFFTFENPSDWAELALKANSYSLFSNAHLIDIRYDKKTLDNSGKSFLLDYLNHPNPNCLLLFKAPNLPAKQLQFLHNHQDAYIIQTVMPSPLLVKQWLFEHLQQLGKFDSQAVDLIYQFNEGNLFACAQLLEKLKLINESAQPLTLDEIKTHLDNQCHYSLYDLTEACLNGDGLKAIGLIRQAYSNKVEPTLILWILTQEIRLLLQLHQAIKQGQTVQTAAGQLKIWSNKIRTYQLNYKKYDARLLTHLLSRCNQLDLEIKSVQCKQTWNKIELIALSLCLGEQIGYNLA